MIRTSTFVLVTILALASVAVSLSSPADAAEPTEPFQDVPAGSLFSDAIVWLADQGITKGCDPPANTRFCADEPVTRGQMAAFLTRAFFLKETGPTFSDTKGSVFSGDISRLAQAGITRGCNPPANAKFCPDELVTRGQMAAFLGRAFNLPHAKNTFLDDNGHVFEAEIAALAAAGITKGCNPPKNDRFCPNEPVTRGQMAAFLWRAFGQPDLGHMGVNRIDPDETIPAAPGDVTYVFVNPEGETRLRYTGPYDLDAGDYILLPPSRQFPVGYTGEVTKMSDGVATIIKANFADAVDEVQIVITPDTPIVAGFQTTGDLAPQGETGKTRTTLPVEWACEGKLEASAAGSLYAEVGAATDMTIGRLADSSKDAHAYIYGDFNAKAEVSAKGSGSCQLIGRIDQKVLGKYVVWAGPVPIHVSLSAGGRGEGRVNASASITATSSYEAHGEIGVARKLGRWGLHNKFEDKWTPPTVTAKASLDARADVIPRFEIFVYGTVGAYVAAGPFVEFNSDLVADPWWDLDAGIHLETGVLAADIITEDDIATIYDDDLFRWNVAQARGPAFPQLKITTTSLPAGTEGVAYKPFTLERTGGLAQWYWEAKGLPKDIKLGYYSGELRGTPRNPGTYNVEVTVKDSRGVADTRNFQLVIDAKAGASPTITTTSLPDATAGEPYNFQLNASSSESCCTWSQTGLPSGLKLTAATGRIIGTPTVVGDVTVTVTAKSSSGASTTKAFTLKVHAGEPADPDQACNGVTSIPVSECQALVALYQSTGGENWSSAAGWFVGDPCGWEHVRCEGGHVKGLYFGSPEDNELTGMSGTLPPELTDLTELEVIYLFGAEDLTGQFPERFWDLPLISVYLVGIGIEDTLPVDLSGTPLEYLAIYGAPKLTGRLSTKLPDTLDYLSITSTGMSGPIASNFHELTHLESLHLARNKFTGGIPTNLPNGLEHLWLYDNQLNSRSDLDSLPASLVALNLSGNALVGTFPSMLAQYPNMEEIYLAEVGLSGSLPPTLPAAIKDLDLSGNSLSGSLPAEWGALKSVRSFDLQNNNLGGLVPSAIVNMGFDPEHRGWGGVIQLAGNGCFTPEDENTAGWLHYVAGENWDAGCS